MSKVDWNGEGLAPIDADVECTFAAEQHQVWHRGTVVYRGKLMIASPILVGARDAQPFGWLTV